MIHILIFFTKYRSNISVDNSNVVIVIAGSETCPLRFEGHAWKTDKNLYKYVEIRR